jgi:proteasome lid subunit RPN8/RPN11
MTIKKSAREIIFKPQPFFTCLISALEVYKRETYGFLFSQNDKDTIDFAYTFQTAERTFGNIYCDDNIEEYLITQANQNFGLTFIGDFHSHTDYKGASTCKPGKTDSKGLKENPNRISVIFSLSTNHENLLAMLMRAYSYDDEQKRIRRAKLILPQRLENLLSETNPSLLNFFKTPQR